MTHNHKIKKLELIINFFANGRRASWDELSVYLDEHEERWMLDDDQATMAKSIRTFQRDKKAIAQHFGLDIIFDKKDKVYYLENKEDIHPDVTRIFEMSEIMSLLQASQIHKDYISLECTQPKGVHHINKLIKAIKHTKLIEIKYKKYADEQPKNIYLYPILLKEYKNRWYIIGISESTLLKTYALDRIQDVLITNRKSDIAIDTLRLIHDQYQYAYGISSHKQVDKVPEVVLCFTHYQGKYIKDLPLHPTQRVISDSKEKDECIISMQVVPSTELIMDILSYGNAVKVIKPKSLANQIHKIAKSLIDIYS